MNICYPSLIQMSIRKLSESKNCLKFFCFIISENCKKVKKKFDLIFFKGAPTPFRKNFSQNFFSSLYLKLQKSEKNVDPIFFNEVRPPSEKNSKSKIFFASLYLNIAKKQKKIELIFFKRGPILMNKIKEIWEFCLMCLLYTTSR